MSVVRVATMNDETEKTRSTKLPRDTVARPDRPDHADPWAMQLIILRNRQDPADHVEVLEAAGAAVVGLLDDARTTNPAGDWAEAVAHWRAGWIRKVARRAENKRWDDVQQLDGVTAQSGAAQVRALIPGPVAPLPPQVKKLQVGGTQFPRQQDAQPQDAVVTVELTPAVDLSTGKAAAQAGHAAQLAYERLSTETADGDTDVAKTLAAWRQDGFRIRVQLPTQQQWAATDRPVRVIDAGLTEISGQAETSRAFW